MVPQIRLPEVSGVYDPALLGKIRWDEASEFGPIKARPMSFAEDAGQFLYFGGFDANFLDAHDTAWIYRAHLETVLEL